MLRHQQDGERFIIAREFQIPANLSALVGGKPRITLTVGGTVKAADRKGQIFVDGARNEQIIADSVVAAKLKLVAHIEILRAGARDIVYDGAQSVGIKNASGAAFGGFDARCHDVIFDENVIIHERRFRFFIGGQPVNEIGHIAKTPGLRQTAHLHVVVSFACGATFGQKAGNIGQQLRSAIGSQDFEILLGNGVG
ncbi:hypothetical protein FHW96_004833 [Novosphingobium sp. SG751A]|nr:hypothetical protein [Novosphingobium sp. SG751A]NOW48643.1 hypothetical protein [Novosphingobium sp. SG751A]